MRPGIPVIWGWIWPRRAESFNEAQAMRPGIPGETMFDYAKWRSASMRPRPCGPGYR